MSRMMKNLLLCAGTLALASCANSPLKSDPAQSAASQPASRLGTVSGVTRSPENMDVISRSAYWGTRYDRAPHDEETAIAYSKSLRDMGSNEEALKVMDRFKSNVKDTPSVNLELGKVLIANDRAFEAIRPLEKAVLDGGPNWQAHSAYGVALDKIGEHSEAQKQYEKALRLSPDNVAVLNNMGLSLALGRQLYKAEMTLRQAANSREGSATVRQNLALVLGFNGKTSEAASLARSDLPPRVADNNIAYFQALVSQPAYWQEFSGDNADMPDFSQTMGAETIDPPRGARMMPVQEETLSAPGAARAAPTGTAPTPLNERPQPQPDPQSDPQPLPETPEDENEDVLSSLSDDARS